MIIIIMIGCLRCAIKEANYNLNIPKGVLQQEEKAIIRSVYCTISY